MNIGVEDFLDCMEDCYCDGAVVNVTIQDDDGTTSFNTSGLQTNKEVNYIYFQDDLDSAVKIKTNNILMINKHPKELGEEIVILTKVKSYTFLIMY